MINLDTISPISAEEAQARLTEENCYVTEVTDDVKELNSAINEAMNSFSGEADKSKVNKAKATIKNFTDYIRSDVFKRDVKETAKATGVSEKKLAETFIGKVLGTISDILGIAIECVRDGIHTVISLLASIINGAIDLVCNVADTGVRIVTLNKTAVNANA